MTVQEVTSFLTISRATLYRLVALGRIPAPVKVGLRRSAWRRDDIEQIAQTGIAAAAAAQQPVVTPQATS